MYIRKQPDLDGLLHGCTAFFNWWIVKITLWCLIVGVALSALGVTAGDF